MFDRDTWLASGMSIAELAEACEVSFSTAWRWTIAPRSVSPLGRRALRQIGLWVEIVEGAA